MKKKTFSTALTARDILERYLKNPLFLTQVDDENDLDLYYGIVVKEARKLDDNYKTISKTYKNILQDIENKFEPEHFNQLTLEINDEVLEFTVDEVKEFKIRKRTAFFAKLVENKDVKGLTVSKAQVRKHLQYFKENYPEYVKEYYTPTLGVGVGSKKGA